MTGQTAQPRPAATSGIDLSRSLAQLGIDASIAYERPDLEERLRASAARLTRPDTVVCVVGEFKQGKSSLVNAMLGDQICPVDDDLATAAITVLRYNDTPTASVRRSDEGQIVTETIEIDQIEQFASESGNRANQRRVQLIEVGLPNRLLQSGVTLVDTPGAGGVVTGYAAATLAFLQTADALLFVTDASAELSAPEIDFLRQAQEKCPVMLIVQSKIDLYPAWQRILDINRGHLQRAAVAADIVPVSSVIRAVALQGQNRELNAESGFPTLLNALKEQVLDRSQTTAALRALADTRNAAQQMLAGYQTELNVLEDPETARDTLQQLQSAREMVNHLRGPGARWNVVLNDGFATLGSQVDYQFRSSMRGLLRAVEEEIEESDPASLWDETSQKLQADIAAAVEETFTRISTDTAELRDTLVALLQDEVSELQEMESADLRVDIFTMWTERDIETTSISGKFFQGLNAMRGSYMGLLMVGMLGNLVGIAMVGPLLVGAGILFGGRQLVEERKKGVTKRRQQARTFVRQFVDDVQFEVGTRIREATRDLQRELRDYFTDRLNELMRTYSETAQSTQQSLQQDESTRDRRATDLRARIEKLNELLKRVEMAEGQL